MLSKEPSMRPNAANLLKNKDIYDAAQNMIS